MFTEPPRTTPRTTPNKFLKAMLRTKRGVFWCRPWKLPLWVFNILEERTLARTVLFFWPPCMMVGRNFYRIRSVWSMKAVKNTVEARWNLLSEATGGHELNKTWKQASRLHERSILAQVGGTPSQGVPRSPAPKGRGVPSRWHETLIFGFQAFRPNFKDATQGVPR